VSRPSAAEDERPTVGGNRVRLRGKLVDGPEGVVCGIGASDYSLRWVHFDGEEKPILVSLSSLRRLPIASNGRRKKLGARRSS
jgi:hypothetical protein